MLVSTWRVCVLLGVCVFTHGKGEGIHVLVYSSVRGCICATYLVKMHFLVGFYVKGVYSSWVL